MKELDDNIIHFLEKQGFVIVSTLDKDGGIHCSAKGIVGVEKRGIVLLLDLYKAQTLKNLKNNPVITLTAVDEHFFIGYALKGKAVIVEKEAIESAIMRKWEERVIRRISKRSIKHIKDEIKSYAHPEANFPLPQYLIKMEVKKIVNLAPLAPENR
jgi:uncharacterized pyridoxamine 5'-phosphate oxidase family protein